MIIVDGASTDGTQEVVRDFISSHTDTDIRFVSEPDNGMYDALNKALDLYTGDAFGVLNSDDAYHDTRALARIAEGLFRADIVHGNLNFVNSHVDRRVVRRWQAQPRPAGGFRTGWMPAHPTFYCRRPVGSAVGYFNPKLPIASDYDWMLRAVELFSYSVECIDHVLVDMQIGGRSTRGLSAHVMHNLEALKSRRKWLDVGVVDYALLAKPLKKINQFL